MSWPAGTTTDVWFRIENKNFRTDEEVRYDIPTSLVSTSLYIGISGLGTPTSTTDWMILKTDFDSNGQIVRKQVKTFISWDNRVSGPWA